MAPAAVHTTLTHRPWEETELWGSSFPGLAWLPLERAVGAFEKQQQKPCSELQLISLKKRLSILCPVVSHYLIPWTLTGASPSFLLMC